MSCVAYCKHSKGLEFFSDAFVVKFSLWRGAFLLLHKVLKSFSKISKAVLRHDRNMFQVNVSSCLIWIASLAIKQTWQTHIWTVTEKTVSTLKLYHVVLWSFLFSGGWMKSCYFSAAGWSRYVSEINSHYGYKDICLRLLCESPNMDSGLLCF